MSEHQFFESVHLIALLLVIMAVALPFASRWRAALQQAGVWLLIGGFLVALFLVGEWLLTP